jgi:hypothetical protein
MSPNKTRTGRKRATSRVYKVVEGERWDFKSKIGTEIIVKINHGRPGSLESHLELLDETVSIGSTGFIKSFD